MTIQYSIPVAPQGANGFFANQLLGKSSSHLNQQTNGRTLKFDMPIPPDVIPAQSPGEKAKPKTKPEKKPKHPENKPNSAQKTLGV